MDGPGGDRSRSAGHGNGVKAGSVSTPTITTFGWVPEFARGFVRDIRPRWAMEEIGQPYDVEFIADAKSDEYRQRQPFGQVPVYRDDGVEIFESGAMVLRIGERGPGLLPDDPAARARAIQWVFAALNSVEQYVMGLVVNDVFEADRPWSSMRHDKVAQDLHARLDHLESWLGDKTWLEGETFTVGDLMMVSVLGGLRGTDVLKSHERLAAYVARGEARPAHQKAMRDHLATFAST